MGKDSEAGHGAVTVQGQDLFYEPDPVKLKNLALTLDSAKSLPPPKKDKRRLVFAPTKYLDQDHLDALRIDFAQLPYEIYELTR